MDKLARIKKLKESSLVAVIRRQNVEDIRYITDALINGGVNALEITVDSASAYNIIQDLKKEYKDELLIGAGTVVDAEDARRAIDANADFIFSPNLDIETVKLANENNVISIPGVMTPTEIVNGYKAGADILKVFPAGTLGYDYFKDLQGPLGHIPLMPTGGVTVNNVGHYIKNGAVAVGVGGSLLHKEAIKNKEFNEITKTAIRFFEAIREARL